MSVLVLAFSASMGACGNDDTTAKATPEGAAGQAAGAPGAGGSPDAAVGGGAEQGGGAGGPHAGGDEGGEGGEGGEGEGRLPTFEAYSFDLLVADYYGDEGLFRLTLADTGASEPEPLFSVPAGHRTLWHGLHGDGVILSLQNDTHGHLYRQPLAGGEALRITHDLAEHEIVEEWETVGETVYYSVGTFMGNSHTHPRALWKAEPNDGSYMRTELTLPDAGQHIIYNLWMIGDWLYLPGSVTSGTGGYVFDRLTPPNSEIEPVDLLDYDFNTHQGGDILIYRGSSEAGGVGIYATNLNQQKPTGERLSPDDVPLGNNPQLHAASNHYFFSTKPAGEGEQSYLADLSQQPFKVVPVLASEDPAAMQYGVWSTRGRYFYLHEGVPGVEVTSYVVDTSEQKPTPRATAKAVGEGWISSAPDERLFSITRPGLWVMKPNDADFALRIDDGLDLDGATVEYSIFSSDGYHTWFALSDGRSFVDDTLESTPPNPIEVTPSDLPEGWTAKYASQVPHGGFLLAVSTDDAEARATRKDQALYYLRRLPSGKYAPAERVDVAGQRYVVRID